MMPMHTSARGQLAAERERTKGRDKGKDRDIRVPVQQY
jgi:hypothetical protein